MIAWENLPTGKKTKKMQNRNLSNNNHGLSGIARNHKRVIPQGGWVVIIIPLYLMIQSITRPVVEDFHSLNLLFKIHSQQRDVMTSQPLGFARGAENRKCVI